MELVRALTEAQNEVLDDASQALHRAHLRHYEAAGAVDRNRIAVGAAAHGHRRILRNRDLEFPCHLRCRQQARHREIPRPQQMPIAVNILAPSDDVALLVDAGFDFDQHRR